MKNIFISYRRHETAGYSLLIHEELERRQPDWEVFIDVQDIAPGSAWRQRLAERITAADVVLVLIGREWLTLEGAGGRRRLEDPEDVTRWEIEEALRQKKQVVPVLVEGASPPDAAQLPESIRSLATLQYVEIRHQSFDADLENLIARLQKRTLRDLLGLRQVQDSLRSWWHWLTPSLAVVVFCLFWVGILDLLAIDTRLATWSFGIAQRFDDLSPDPDLKLLALPASFDPAASEARGVYADLLQRLSRAGAKAVLFDLYFDTEGPDDQKLARAMSQARARGTEVYFGFRALRDGAPDAVPALARAASGTGLICAGGRLGYTQVMPLAFNYRETLVEETGEVVTGVSPYPSLALLGAFGPVEVAGLDATERWLALKGKGQLLHPRFSVLHRITRAQKACPALEKDTWVAALFLRLSPLGQLRSAERRLELSAVLDGEVGTRMADQVVIVGHESQADLKQIAFGEPRYGYELYADAINTLRHGRIAQPLALLPEFLLMLASAAAGGWLGIRLQASRAVVRWPLMSGLVLLYLVAGVLFIAWGDTILHTSYELFALLVAYLWFRRYARRRLGGSR